MSLGQSILVEDLQAFGTGVVKCAEKSRIPWNDQASLGQSGANSEIIQHLCEGAGVRSTDRPAACSAVVGGLVRVIHAVRPMPDHEHESREVSRQADLPELALGDVDHLLQGISKLTVVGFSIGRVPLQSKPSPRMRLNQTGQSMANPTRQPGE